MPYALRKVPKKDLYWVVNKETGKKHSKEGLPKETAEAQRRALYAVESGYKLTGGSAIDMKVMQQIAQSAYRGKTKLEIGSFKLLTSTPTLKFYKDDSPKRIVISVRGTDLADKTDLSADALAVIGKLRSSERWKKDLEKIKEVQSKFSPKEYRYIAVGHSLGGAIIDLMLRDNLIQNALSYNPLVEPQELKGNPRHRRIYHKDDPLFQIFGRFIPNVEVKTTAEPFWKYYLQYSLPFNLGELFKLYDRHRIARFKGGKKLEGGVTINDVRRWLAQPISEENAQRLRLTGQYRDTDITNGDVINSLLLASGGLAGFIEGIRQSNPYLGIIVPTLALLGQVAVPLLMRELPNPPTREQEERNRDVAVFTNPMNEAQQTAQRIDTAQRRAEQLQRAQVHSRVSNVIPRSPQFVGDVRLDIARQQQEEELNQPTSALRVNRSRTTFAPTMTRESDSAGTGLETTTRVLGPEDFEDEDVGDDRNGDGIQDGRSFANVTGLSGRGIMEDEEEFYKDMFPEEELEEEEQLEDEELEDDSMLIFEDQLKELGYDPKKYLRKVRSKAKKFGYNSKKLHLCTDGIHKLQIETPDGKIVKFGRVGYGDFLIWSFLEQNGKVDKGEAKSRRKRFLKSHSAIKGDWESNKYSANNLAMKILW